MDILELTYWGNSLRQWATGAGITVITFVVFKVVQRIATRRLQGFAQKTSTDIDDLVVDLLSRTRFYLLLVVSLYIGGLALTTSETTHAIMRTITSLAVIIQAGVWGNGLIHYLLTRTGRQRPGEEPPNPSTIKALRFIARLILWSVVVLLALDQMGFNITALITGLGIGGIAIALALQNILGDLFASLSILLDKPFVPGDFITVDTLQGAVEHIGLKTTRVRSISGEQIILSNTDLMRSRIRNYKRMVERRIVFSIGVRYDSSYEQLRKIPSIMRQIIESESDARFDRSHFQAYGEWALLFETVYFVKSPDYLRYMDMQERINLEVHRRFREEGITFAFPTRTLTLQDTRSGGRTME
jgi:small-conductance mechanosensitive channel